MGILERFQAAIIVLRDTFILSHTPLRTGKSLLSSDVSGAEKFYLVMHLAPAITIKGYASSLRHHRQ